MNQRVDTHPMMCAIDNHQWYYRDIILEDGRRMATCNKCPAVWLGGTVYLPTSQRIDEKIVRQWIMEQAKQ